MSSLDNKTWKGTYATGGPEGHYYYIEDRQVSYDEWTDYWRRHKRVGREQREQYTEHLTQMWMDEYLTDEEFNDRHTKAMTAVTEFDLTSLVMDLPAVSTRPSTEEKVQALELARAAARSAEAEQRYEVALKSYTRKPMHPITAWSLSLFASLAVLGIPCPVAAHLYHGLGHSPVGFAAFLIVGMLGTIFSALFLIFSILDA